MKFLKEALLEIIEQVEANEEAQRRIKRLEQHIRDLENASYDGEEEETYLSVINMADLNGVSCKDFEEEELVKESRRVGYEIAKDYDDDVGEINAYHPSVWRSVYPGLKRR
jgi:hypothetical protein